MGFVRLSIPAIRTAAMICVQVKDKTTHIPIARTMLRFQRVVAYTPMVLLLESYNVEYIYIILGNCPCVAPGSKH